jgi:hypothetical protein
MQTTINIIAKDNIELAVKSQALEKLSNLDAEHLTFLAESFSKISDKKKEKSVFKTIKSQMQLFVF